MDSGVICEIIDGKIPAEEIKRLGFFCLGCLFAILEKYQMVAISFPCAITKTQKITIYYVEKVGGMLRSSQIMIKFAAICNAEFAK
ncbi:hypothetical protein NXV02_21025 [Bacteroides ovatus]|nr:hypothetical protein [Bacteroides ovatus]